ncbi:hypothetical protein IWZ00DRAFT_487821 [Phyllosticta capitalensis]
MHGIVAPSIPESGTLTNPPLLPTTTTRVILTSLIGHPFTHQEALSSSLVTVPSIRESHSPCLARAAASLAPTLSAMYRGEVDRSALLGVVCSPSAFEYRVREADGRSSAHPPVSGRGWRSKPVDGLSGEKTSLLADADCACEVDDVGGRVTVSFGAIGPWNLASQHSSVGERHKRKSSELHGWMAGGLVWSSSPHGSPDDWSPHRLPACLPACLGLRSSPH